MDRLTSLTAFVRVVDSGGFSAAGRRLNMSTTMVSNHVQSLEDRLGARLLQRTTRKVSLTEVGKAYYDRCVQILADIEQADDIAGAQQSRRAARCASTPQPTSCSSSRPWLRNSWRNIPTSRSIWRLANAPSTS
jgi:DNA-binding transcriptional LysR family regulator